MTTEPREPVKVKHPPQGPHRWVLCKRFDIPAALDAGLVYVRNPDAPEGSDPDGDETLR